MNWDPFWYMIDHKKTYGWFLVIYFSPANTDGGKGFVMSMKELPETIRTLWGTVREFYLSHPQHVAKDNSMKFISKNGGNWYNGCHCTFHFTFWIDALKRPIGTDSLVELRDCGPRFLPVEGI
jgi:hypothetical protein